jgi:NAD(P)-dependent dehydrogenase (short-subunit alcohol dehydrogenase family)
MDRLKDKIAIVTGGANGIGRAISELFAAEGAWVLVADIEQDPAEDTVCGIRKKEGRADFCRTDVSVYEDVARAVSYAVEQHGRIDILVNNAAYLSPTFHDVVEATDEEWNRCFRVAVMGTQYFTKETLPHMIPRKQGSIVNVVSIQALVGCPTSVAYAATKSALLGFTVCAAYDYGKYNIRVNALCPGPIQTRISPSPGEAHYVWQCQQTVLDRVGYPHEVAYAALFLASDEASYVTGVSLPVDGGWVSK